MYEAYSMIDQQPIYSSLPGVVIFLLATGSFTIPLIHYLIRERRIIELYAIVFNSLATMLSWIMLFTIKRSGQPIVYMFGGWPPPVGIIYVVDFYSGLLGVLVTSILLLITIYSVGYMEDDQRLYLYYTLLLAVETGLLGCLYTGDFFNLFVMLEVASISAYALVAYYRSRRLAIEAAMKYAIYGAMATTIFFIAIIFAYGSLGTLNMADMHYKISGKYFVISGSPIGNIVYGVGIFTILALFTFTFKAAIFPNHFWLPDAHSEAPSPVSALLSGLVVKIGVYCIARFLYTIYGGVDVIGMFRDNILLTIIVLGLASSIFGAIMMTIQRDLKKFIAYSTVMNIGYIIMGIGLGTYLGILASTYHIINHGVAKALAFLSAGILIRIAGSRKIDELRGMGRLYKGAGIAFGISVLTLAGIPYSIYLLANIY
ncbi:MAG: cation:proton antiporter [Thermoprotei archaeon]|nr:MAG: cation:proton antiporter [Thermoprotei archaeon]